MIILVQSDQEYRLWLAIGDLQFPMTLFAVGGTQADTDEDNKLMIMKMYDMYKTKYDESI